ncbi:hypothetical protein CYMTET_20802 [Cymbomonas tetramitiformis]|uniref:Uncharacterized protein n=1 Tax=Cymbomonas tetramitiformis TaxID=36881 RepID=A0AAE0G3T5_9CHLO|nr:hypothetical protein CYMTET_20802 [Cymbomonas tetramitiformis]
MAAEEQAASVNAEGANAGEHTCGEPSGEPSGEAAFEAAVEAAAAAVEAAENGEETDPADSARLNDKRMLLFCARKDWRRRWCKRFSVACRRRTNNKGKSKGDRAPGHVCGERVERGLDQHSFGQQPGETAVHSSSVLRSGCPWQSLVPPRLDLSRVGATHHGSGEGVMGWTG